MSKTKKHTTLYDYLDQSGVMAWGTADDIERSKVEYWKRYRTDKKRQERKKRKEYAVALDKKEQAYIEREALLLGKSVSMFLKDAAFAYLGTFYLNPNKADLIKIEQILSRYYSELERISEFADIIEIQNGIDAIVRIEGKLEMLFSRPPSLDILVKRAVEENPYCIGSLKKIIQEYDNKVKRQEEI
jgi:hypothetical protein